MVYVASSSQFYVYIFCFAFSRGNICKRKNINLVLTTHLVQWLGRVFKTQERKKEKKQLVQDLIPPLSIYEHMCILYSYTHIYMPRFSPSGFFGPSRCLVQNFGLTTSSTLCAVGVCVCVYTYIHAHTLPPASKDREDTDNTPISPSVKNNPAEPSQPRPPTRMNKLRIHEHMCTQCSECVRRCVCWCQKTLV